MKKVTTKDLEKYILERKGNQSLSEFLGDYADLSDVIIDESCNDLNLSGSKFVGTIFKGVIKNLILRDCIFDRIETDSDATLIYPDLRGTCLTEGRDRMVDFHGNDLDEVLGYSSIEQDSALTLINPLLSLGSTQDVMQYTLQGAVQLDPCYLRGSDAAPKALKRGSLEDLKKQKIENLDFSHFNLNNLDISNKEFINCNFAKASASGLRAHKTKFRNCNFQGTDFSKKILGLWHKAAYLAEAEFYDCDATNADVTGVNLDDSNLHNFLAINLNANGFGWLNGKFTVNGATAPGVNLQGANLPGIQAKELDAPSANLSDTNLSDGDFTKAQLQNAKISGNQEGIIYELTNLEGADVTKSRGIPANANYLGTLKDSIEAYELGIARAKHQKQAKLTATYDKWMSAIVIASIAVAVVAPHALPAIAIIADITAFTAITVYAIDKLASNCPNWIFKCSDKIHQWTNIRIIPEHRLSQQIAKALGVNGFIERRHDAFINEQDSIIRDFQDKIKAQEIPTQTNIITKSREIISRDKSYVTEEQFNKEKKNEKIRAA